MKAALGSRLYSAEHRILTAQKLKILTCLLFKIHFTLNQAKKKNSCVSGSLPEKTGSVGRLYFFFFFYFFFFANSTKQFFLFSPKKYRQCHQAMDPGDMYYGRSFIDSGKSRDPRTLPWGTP